MATYALTGSNVKVYVAELDLTGYSNNLSLEATVNELDATTFGQSYMVRKAGLTDTAYTVNGYADFAADAVDDTMNAKLGSVLVTTICPTTGAVGEPAYVFKGLKTTYTPISGAVGDMAAFSLGGSGATLAAAGKVLYPKTAVSGTANGTATVVGAASAAQTLHGTLHVFSTTGSPTLTVTVESDVDGDFLSPTTRLTFTQATGETSEWKTTAGAITDTYYRAVMTYGGTGTITAAVSVGIR